jgi:hypothetical protein
VPGLLKKKSSFGNSVILCVMVKHSTKKNMFTEYRMIDKLREFKINFEDNKKRFTRFDFLTTVELNLERATCVPVDTVYQPIRLAHSKSCLCSA